MIWLVVFEHGYTLKKSNSRKCLFPEEKLGLTNFYKSEPELYRKFTWTIRKILYVTFNFLILKNKIIDTSRCNIKDFLYFRSSRSKKNIWYIKVWKCISYTIKTNCNPMWIRALFIIWNFIRNFQLRTFGLSDKRPGYRGRTG